MLYRGPYENLPLDSFALAPGEVLRRPEAVRRLRFEHVYPRAYWFSAAPYARSLVPIELAEPGDEQVVVHRKAEEQIATPLDIDFLVDLPSVVSVVADRLVRVRRPLPQIRELFVVHHSATVDQATLSNLPGLVSLSLGSGMGSRELRLDQIEGYDWETDKLDLDVLLGMPGLRDLRIHALAAHSIEPLQYLERLEHLRLEGIDRVRSALPLANLTQLRWLALDCRTWLGRLKGLVKLERLELMEVSLASLRPFRAFKKLSALALSGRGVRSLEGIADLEALEDLFLARTGVRDLSPLEGMPRLCRLTLISPLNDVDFTPLGQIENLQTLVILATSSISNVSLRSIDFVAGLKHLQELEIMGTIIAEARLDVLSSLPDLRRVRLLGDYGDQVERLQRQMPQCDIQVTSPPVGHQGDTIRVGEIEIRKIGEDFWSIMQDLSDLLVVENNFVADRKVRQAIHQHAAELYTRLEFDPDADFISIRAGNETDIRLAAEIVQALINS
jgi:hypothetical protein